MLENRCVNVSKYDFYKPLHASMSQWLLTRFLVDFSMCSASKPTTCTAKRKPIQQSNYKKIEIMELEQYKSPVYCTQCQWRSKDLRGPGSTVTWEPLVASAQRAEAVSPKW